MRRFYIPHTIFCFLLPHPDLASTTPIGDVIKYLRPSPRGSLSSLRFPPVLSFFSRTRFSFLSILKHPDNGGARSSSTLPYRSYPRSRKSEISSSAPFPSLCSLNPHRSLDRSSKFPFTANLHASTLICEIYLRGGLQQFLSQTRDLFPRDFSLLGFSSSLLRSPQDPSSWITVHLAPDPHCDSTRQRASVCRAHGGTFHLYTRTPEHTGEHAYTHTHTYPGTGRYTRVRARARARLYGHATNARMHGCTDDDVVVRAATATGSSTEEVYAPSEGCMRRRRSGGGGGGDGDAKARTISHGERSYRFWPAARRRADIFPTPLTALIASSSRLVVTFNVNDDVHPLCSAEDLIESL